MNHVLTHRKYLFDQSLLEGNDTHQLILNKLTNSNHYGVGNIIKKRPHNNGLKSLSFDKNYINRHIASSKSHWNDQ